MLLSDFLNALSRNHGLTPIIEINTKVMRVACISLLIFICMSDRGPASAAPANPEPSQLTQPDGTIFQTIMRGDEFQGWLETSDGYTVVKNPVTGFYEYAFLGSGGELAPSGIRVKAAVGTQMTAQGLSAAQVLTPPKGLRPLRNTALEQYQGKFLETLNAAKALSAPQAASALTGTWAPTFVSGPKKILLILVNFQDAGLSATAATYWSNAVHDAAGSSVAKYYQDISFGNISIAPVAHTQAGSPAGVVTVSLAQNHPNCANGSCSYSVESAWINSALAAAAPYVNFAALDANSDGTISVDETLVYFIVAGYETSAGNGLTPSYWAHAWGGTGVSVSGKYVDHWALNGEMYNASTRMQMGVIAHEMGHALGGLPDLYDISNSNAGLGIFSLMAGGSWGRRYGEIGGTTPVGLDAWSRQYLGWSNPQTPANGATISFPSPLSSASSQIMLINSAISASEYWLVENRPPVGWDAGMYPYLGTWTGGLLIQHIDLNVGSKPANSFNKYVSGAHQGNLAVEPSTAACSLKVVTTPSSASQGCQTILYYTGNSATFNNSSSPTSSYYSGVASGLGVTNISAPGSTMTATAQNSVTSTCSYTISPTSQTFTSSGGTGSVTVTASASSCAWTATSSLSWAAITSGSGTGNGTATFSVSANTGSDRTGNLTIADQTFTITQTGSGTTTTNLILNPGFESGNVNWTEYTLTTSAIISNDSLKAHAGSWFAWLGGYNSAYDYIYQDVTIPANTSLQFWYNISTTETTTTSVYDTLAVEIRKPADNSVLSTLATLSNLNKTSGWVQSQQYNLSAFSGQTIRLRFSAATDTSAVTSFKVDDVSLSSAGASSCTFTISPTSQTFASTGGTGSVAVTASATSCTWAATSPVSWATITSASGIGSSTVTFSVAANTTGAARTGGLTLAGQTFTITQSATQPVLLITSNPASQALFDTIQAAYNAITP